MSPTTTIEINRANEAMKAMAAAVFPAMEWRHHGIGVLQGYIRENTMPEVRLHVWARELLKNGMDQSGDIHDHRFNLVSHVLCGVVGHEEIVHTADEGGDWAMLELTHARAAKESAYHGPTRPLEGRFRVRRNSFAIPTGHSYYFRSGVFHRSPILGSDITVSVVEKHQQSATPARILYPISTPPVMAFGHEMDWSVITPVLQRALEALKKGT